ncbi:integrase, catalytic region, zinc finger, CCHC-type containing protein [Tanacetum coccineum]|uniref:Integrase, catalytic region, zinc finger, CCHC-type containing protein n=1 Tax=Tanacetum coccineum TaxID=301880 RepID=A0ABQ4XB33_9ASTR
MRDNPQLQQDDLLIWLTLKYKFERLHVATTPCRPSDVRPRDQDDPYDDAYPEGENSQRGRRRLSMELLCLENHLLVKTLKVNKVHQCQIVARRENGSIVSITESDYKNLNKNDIEDMYLLIVNDKIDEYVETGLLWSLLIFIRSIKKYKVFSIVSKPVYAIIYKNNKKEKRVMRHQEFHKFCDATLKRVLEGLKIYNNNVKHGYVTLSLSKEDAEYLQLFQEGIEEKTPYELLRRRKPTMDYFKVFESKCFILNTKDYLTKFDPKSYEDVFLVDDDLDEEEPIKVTKKKNLENDIKDETVEVDKIVNIKESKNHPLDNVIGNINQRALRAKNFEKSHDHLALVAHKGSSFRTTSPYYATHPSSVVDYDDDYQGDAVQNNSEYPLTSTMILIARAITQCFSNPTNNRLRTSSNTRNQAIVQGHYSRNCLKPRVQDLKYFMEQMLLAKQDEEGVILTDEQNDFLFVDAYRMEEIEELRPSYDYPFLSEVQTPSTSYENPLSGKDNQEQKYSKQPKIINNIIRDDQIDNNIIFDEPNRDINSVSVEYDNNVLESYELEKLARNAYKEAEKQKIIAKKVQQQNIVLTKQLESYKEKDSQSKFIHDRDVIRDLEQQDDVQVELQKTQSILKRQMSEDEDKYHDIVLDFEAKAKKNVDVMLKLGYANPYTLKKAISHNLKLYDASWLEDSKIHMNVRDTEDILDDATKSQIKIERIPIAIDKKTKLKDVLCVSCAKNVLIMRHDKCLAYYKLNVISKVRRALFTTPRIVKSKVEDTTPVVSKTRFSVVQIVLWIIDSGCSKHMTGDRSLLENFVKKFMGTIRSGNDHFAEITGYGDYLHGNITVCHVYYVEGLGHNLFSVGQFCGGDLEVAFCSNTCYVRNLEGDDLLTGARESNLYKISISDMATSSPICLMSKATSTKSWLWRRRLSHLNFSTLNDLTKHDLVDGLSKFIYEKDHLCSACEQGKSKKASHPPKVVPSNHSKLELLHMDLCGPMRVASINGKRYILMIVDDYSRFTWVYFLRTKDETPEIIKNFIT